MAGEGHLAVEAGGCAVRLRQFGLVAWLIALACVASCAYPPPPAVEPVPPPVEPAPGVVPGAPAWGRAGARRSELRCQPTYSPCIDTCEAYEAEAREERQLALGWSPECMARAESCEFADACRGSGVP